MLEQGQNPVDFEHAPSRAPGEHPEAVAARRWIGLGVGSLILAGVLAFSLVVARAPIVSRLVTDPAVFRRCLVVHVDLSLLVWIYSFTAALLFLLPGHGASARTSRTAVWLAVAGVLMMLLSAGAPGAEPVLANYVPMIDHWMFVGGLIAFGSGVVISVFDRRLLPASQDRPSLLPIPAAAIPGLRATALALLLAALTFASSWLERPEGLDVKTYYELTNWGGGHTLQLASTAALLSVWLILVGGLLGRAPMSRRVSSTLFGILVLPWCVAPLLPLRGVRDVAARDAFTLLMRWCLWPVVVVFAFLLIRAIWMARREGALPNARLRDPRFTGFVASVLLIALGCVLGALIRGSTTMIPAHYHAAIGAVTVSFMALCYSFLEALGVAVKEGRFARRFSPWQPALFGVGQLLFALGFGVAGMEGTARKVFGHEQNVRTLAQSVGLGVMGIGGLVAITGGIAFLAIVARAWLRQRNDGARGWAPIAPLAGGNHG
jgi:cytochrome c oxidase subunit 1